jgi:hypothetical protein
MILKPAMTTRNKQLIHAGEIGEIGCVAEYVYKKTDSRWQAR